MNHLQTRHTARKQAHVKVFIVSYYEGNANQSNSELHCQGNAHQRQHLTSMRTAVTQTKLMGGHGAKTSFLGCCWNVSRLSLYESNMQMTQKLQQINFWMSLNLGRFVQRPGFWGQVVGCACPPWENILDLEITKKSHTQWSPPPLVGIYVKNTDTDSKRV